MSVKRVFELQEIIKILEEEEGELFSSVEDVVILPPLNATGNVTDEDSGDENEVTIRNLPGSQLRNLGEIITVDAADDWDSEDETPLALLKRTSKGNENEPTHKKKRYSWQKRDIRACKENNVFFTAENNLSPIDTFELFFCEEVWNLITNMTNNYALQKNQIINVTQQEIKCFFGVLLLSGYAPLPRRSMYWENSSDCNNKLVCNAISRDRFDKIMTNLHCADNTDLILSDKYAKVRPLFEILNKKFLEFGPVVEKYSVDEAMVPYFGKHGGKQFIKNKPIRWGYKLWVGCDSSGYIFWCDLYQGAGANAVHSYSHMSLGANVVLTFCDKIRSRGLNINYHVFMDNFFTSLELFEELKLRGIRGTGTIRDCRVKNSPFLNKKEFKKKDRGSYDYAYNPEAELVACRWNDNSVVTVISNAEGVYPIRQVKRYSRQERKHLTISQPNVINSYNKNMGGVDRSDQNISLYRTSIRGKKWYFPLVAHCLDMAVNNAWRLHKNAGGKFDNLSFRRRIAITLLETNRKTLPRGPSRPSVLEHCDSRYDRIDHFITTQERRTRCRVCHTNATTKCEKCEVALHLKCFKAYHKKE